MKLLFGKLLLELPSTVLYSVDFGPLVVRLWPSNSSSQHAAAATIGAFAPDSSPDQSGSLPSPPSGSRSFTGSSGVSSSSSPRSGSFGNGLAVFAI